jgi:hypothetical protein
MSNDRPTEEQGFLARWARRKAEAREAAPAEPKPVPAADAEAAMPELPSLESLTSDSDFSAFFHPKVGEDVRRAALKKLFSDPQFNVMDGLDVYIDDYSKSDPIPAAMLAGLKQAQRILTWAEGKDEMNDTDDAKDTESAPRELESEPGRVAQAGEEPMPEADQ